MTPCPKTKPIRLKGKAYTEFRRQVYESADGICQDCGAYAPMRDEDGVFDVFSCGHVHHAKRIGSGGEDVLSNKTIWLCSSCHLKKEHGLKWSKGNK